jgi:hypothetical protein
MLLWVLIGCAVNTPPKDPAVLFPMPSRVESSSQVGGINPILPSSTRVFISNKFIKLGIDPRLGGAITYLSEIGQPNLVSNHDYGRQIQNSIYSGPIPYEPNGQKPHPVWANNGWNPVQSGDYAGTPAGIIEWHKIDSTSFYVKSNGIQWPVINVPGECIFENWIRLRDNTVWVRSRTTMQRQDRTFYNPTYQETPAVCLTGPYHRFVYYGGSKPFTNDALSVHPESVNTNTFYLNSESWGAMVDQNNRGIGLFRPNTFQFVTSFSGQRGTGGEYDFTSGYMTGLPVEQIDYNGVYEFDYVLILGSVDDIRRFVYNQPRPRTVPDFVFDTGRKGWSYYNTRDQGWPIRNTMNVQWEGTKPELFRVSSPFIFFAAAQVPRLYVQAAFTTNATSARLIWTRIGDRDYRDKANQETSFPIVGDGQMRVYEIDLSQVPTWQGHITRLAIEPITHEGLQRGGTMKLKSVTATKP